MKIFLDVTRLAARMFRGNPSGIDRVEYAYAKHLLDADSTVCVFTAPVFSGAIRRARALDILGRVERAWRLDASVDADPNYAALRRWLDSPLDLNAHRPVRVRSAKRGNLAFLNAGFFPLRDLVRAEARLDRSLSRSEGEPSLFFHASHALLDKPRMFDWLKSAGMRSAFFIHDAIPIESPEFFPAGDLERHATRLATVSAHAGLVIVNSRDTRRAVTAHLSERGKRVPDIEVVPLAIGSAFGAVKQTAPRRPKVPYFLCVGSIEPRKNLLFLLEVWRGLIKRHGINAPRLVIAGRRGWENENIIDALERSRVLGPYVAEASDLSDAGLARLMADSAGVLAPSITEGFGLPIVEALAAGAPVVASDIPAHREVSDGYALFADSIDGLAWISAIEALMDETSDVRRERLAKIAGYQPLSWEAHVAAARDLMERCARGP